MRLFDYTDYIRGFFKDHDIEFSETAISTFKNERYLNRESLERMSDTEVIHNIQDILNDTLRLYRQRVEKGIMPIKLSDKDTRPAIQAGFCKLPPICRRPYRH